MLAAYNGGPFVTSSGNCGTRGQSGTPKRKQTIMRSVPFQRRTLQRRNTAHSLIKKQADSLNCLVFLTASAKHLSRYSTLGWHSFQSNAFKLLINGYVLLDYENCFTGLPRRQNASSMVAPGPAAAARAKPRRCRRAAGARCGLAALGLSSRASSECVIRADSPFLPIGRRRSRSQMAHAVNPTGPIARHCAAALCSTGPN